MKTDYSRIPPREKIKPAAFRFGVTVYFLRKAISDGRLSYIKVGNCFMIDTNELQRLIDSNTYRKNK